MTAWLPSWCREKFTVTCLAGSFFREQILPAFESLSGFFRVHNPLRRMLFTGFAGVSFPQLNLCPEVRALYRPHLFPGCSTGHSRAVRKVFENS